MVEYLVFEFMEKLNNIMNLQIKKISKDNFSRYGQLISTQDFESQNINEETTKSFYDLVNIEIYGDDKQCRVNIFKSIKRNFPLEINCPNFEKLSFEIFLVCKFIILFNFSINSKTRYPTIRINI